MKPLKPFVFLYLLCQLEAVGAPKIVGLAQIRNESHVIEQFLRAFALYADALVVLDDASTDETLSIIRKLASELNIELIIENEVSAWEQGFEIQNREKLLTGGRRVGGTHFLFLDADQMFSAECQKNNWLKNTILSLQSGQVVKFPVINAWGSIDKYRNDKHCNPLQPRWLEAIAICDDGKCNYQSNIIWSHSKVLHITKWPANLTTSASPKEITIKDLPHGVLHYKCVNLEDIPFKLVWYMCLEYIRANEKQPSEKAILENAKQINHFYEKMYDGGKEAHNIQNAQCSNIPSSWYDYDFFDPNVFSKPNEIRKNDLKKWFKTYGPEYFANLNIWNNPYFINFLQENNLAGSRVFIENKNDSCKELSIGHQKPKSPRKRRTKIKKN